MDLEELEIFANDATTSVECLQVVPSGKDCCVMLFLLADPDFTTTVSVIYEVGSFSPGKMRQLLLTTEWLMSISVAPNGDLYALEATTNLWRLRSNAWTRDQVATSDMRRICAELPQGPLLFGTDGKAFRQVGDTWQAIPPITDTTYNDMHFCDGSPSFACGTWGALHRLETDRWTAVETNCGETFRGLDISKNGSIRLAGDNGTCLHLSGGEAIPLGGTDLTCFCVRTFKGSAYWGDEAGVYIEENDMVVPFEGTEIASDMRCDEDFLYVAGLDTAWQFDGKRWKTLTLVYDNGLRLV